MLVVYGTKSFKKHLANFAERECAHCSNNVPDAYLRVHKWFSIYWIPLIPYSLKYYRMCPICGHGERISKIKDVQGLLPIK